MEKGSFQEFKNSICHQKKNAYKVTNSIGVYDMYKKIRKNQWYNIGRPVTEKEFYAIIRGVNKLLAEKMLNGETIHFPERMGKLELRKIKTGAKLVDDKLKITYPPDWKETWKLWYSDEEAFKDRIVLRKNDPYNFYVKYMVFDANYENKNFYRFTIHQKLRRTICEKARQGLIDTLW